MHAPFAHAVTRGSALMYMRSEKSTTRAPEQNVGVRGLLSRKWLLSVARTREAAEPKPRKVQSEGRTGERERERGTQEGLIRQKVYHRESNMVVMKSTVAITVGMPT